MRPHRLPYLNGSQDSSSNKHNLTPFVATSRHIHIISKRKRLPLATHCTQTSFFSALQTNKHDQIKGGKGQKSQPSWETFKIEAYLFTLLKVLPSPPLHTLSFFSNATICQDIFLLFKQTASILVFRLMWEDNDLKQIFPLDTSLEKKWMSEMKTCGWGGKTVSCKNKTKHFLWTNIFLFIFQISFSA